MDRRQGLQHAVLGILFRADDGLHGWALKQECEIAFGCVWEINIGRIYRALHKMAALGLVEPVDVEGLDRAGRGRPRRVFRISMRGREELAKFVRDARKDTQWERRDEFSVRLLLSGQVFMSDRVRLVEWERQRCERRLRAVSRRRHMVRRETRDAALVNLLIDGGR
jgi:DNA-binding PadR family transcriptional regulator